MIVTERQGFYDINRSSRKEVLRKKKKWSLVDSVKRLVHGCCPFFHALKIHPALEIPASRLADAGFWFL